MIAKSGSLWGENTHCSRQNVNVLALELGERPEVIIMHSDPRLSDLRQHFTKEPYAWKAHHKIPGNSDNS